MNYFGINKKLSWLKLRRPKDRVLILEERG
jgi:hypothetical protein